MYKTGKQVKHKHHVLCSVMVIQVQPQEDTKGKLRKTKFIILIGPGNRRHGIT